MLLITFGLTYVICRAQVETQFIIYINCFNVVIILLFKY